MGGRFVWSPITIRCVDLLTSVTRADDLLGGASASKNLMSPSPTSRAANSDADCLSRTPLEHNQTDVDHNAFLGALQASDMAARQ